MLQLPDRFHMLRRNIKMKILYLTLLFHATLQLQCDKGQITAHVGGEFLLICKYDTKTFRYNKKYWCQGDSKSACEIVADSEGGGAKKNTHRFHIIDAGRRGLFVKVTGLQFEDTGVYWVGIDKIYADIMTSVNVVITEVPVSKPRLWPLSSLVDRPTCWGQPVTVRCGCTTGTGVHYSWYQNTNQKDVLLHHSSDLYLHCGRVDKDSDYYCVCHNDISIQGSDILSVQVPMPSDNSCIYVIKMQGQPVYNCAHRMGTTTVQTPPLSTCQPTRKSHSDAGNQSLQLNQTDPDLFFSRSWTGLPFWYMLLRWGSFASLVICLCIVIECTKARHKHVKRKRRVRFKQMPHLAQ